MKQKTLTGRVKDIPTAPYRVDFDGEQGSDFSAYVLDFLEPYWRHDVVLAEWPVAGTRLRYDYVNLTRRIVCEVDGSQHDSYNAHLHGGSRQAYMRQIKNDIKKDQIAQLNDFLMIRIKPKDLPLTKEWFLTHYNVTL